MAGPPSKKNKDDPKMLFRLDEMANGGKLSRNLHSALETMDHKNGPKTTLDHFKLLLRILMEEVGFQAMEDNAFKSNCQRFTINDAHEKPEGHCSIAVTAAGPVTIIHGMKNFIVMNLSHGTKNLIFLQVQIF